MLHDKHESVLFYKINIITLQIQIVDILCYVLAILGLVGNVLGLFIFSSSRRSWRISSVYAFLATCSSITNLFCTVRYVFILHSTSRNLLHELVGHEWWACKLYEFSSSFRVISSWITLFWMFERLMRVSRRLKLFSNRWRSFKIKFIIPVLMMIVILICVIGPPVYMFQPQIFHNGTTSSTINIMICELHPNASINWQKYFHEVHLGMNHFTIRCLLSELIPTGVIILFNSYIVYHVVRLYHRLHRTRSYQPHNRQSRTTSWMNIVLILHSTLFLSSLFAHIIGHFTVVEAHETWWILLSVLINCSLNFYVYCLSGKAFRNEIRRFIQRCKIRLSCTLQACRQRSPDSRTSSYEMNNLQVLVQLKDISPDNLIEGLFI